MSPRKLERYRFSNPVCENPSEGQRHHPCPFSHLAKPTSHPHAMAPNRLVKKFGEGNWSPIARALNEATGKTEATGRIGKQCRERWNHHLSPGLRKDPWTPEEEVLVVDAHKRLGNR